MARKPDDWMPLYIGAYLADTPHLTREQHGAYLLLLMAYWRHGAALPADDARLAAIAKATPAEWRKLKPVIAEFFTETNGTWSQKRVEEELTRAREKSEAKARAGKIGSQTRWQTDGKTIADASLRHRQTDAPLPLPEQKEEDDENARAHNLLLRICEILRIELQADPERVTWKRQVSEMLRDGLTEAEIIAATDLARTRGKVNLAYIRTIALNPKPKDADNAAGKRSTPQQGRGIREAVEHALAATRRDQENDHADRAGQPAGASRSADASPSRSASDIGGDHPPSRHARSDLPEPQHDDRGTEPEIPAFLLRSRPSSGVENRPSVQALPARSAEPMVSDPRAALGASEGLNA